MRTNKVNLCDSANDESDGVGIRELVLVEIAGINGVNEAAGVLIFALGHYVRRLAPGHRLWGSKTTTSAKKIYSGLTEFFIVRSDVITLFSPAKRLEAAADKVHANAARSYP